MTPGRGSTSRRDDTTSNRDDTTVDIVIACLRGALVSGVLGVPAVLVPDGAVRRVLVAVALAAGAVAAVHYLLRRGHTPGRPVSRPRRDAAE